MLRTGDADAGLPAAAIAAGLNVPTNMLGGMLPQRLAMALPPAIPVVTGEAVLKNSLQHSRSLHSLRSMSSLGSLTGSPLHIRSTHELIASSSTASLIGLSSDGTRAQLSRPIAPRRPRERNPITGDDYSAPSNRPPRRNGDARDLLASFPPRGSLARCGRSVREANLESELWAEGMRRERALRQLRIAHAAHHPPWVPVADDVTRLLGRQR